MEVTVEDTPNHVVQLEWYITNGPCITKLGRCTLGQLPQHPTIAEFLREHRSHESKEHKVMQRR